MNLEPKTFYIECPEAGREVAIYGQVHPLINRVRRFECSYRDDCPLTIKKPNGPTLPGEKCYFEKLCKAGEY